MSAKKKRKRPDIERPYNGGQWTKARFHSFVKSALRGARWPAKFECIKKAFVKNGPNPKNGRMCKLHRCPQCGELFPQGEMCADHVVPVIGPEGFTTWDDFISRLFVEADGFTAMCEGCHKRITNHERELRSTMAKGTSRDGELFSDDFSQTKE